MMKTRDIEKGTYYRELTLDRKHINEEARIVPASLSSETEVKRWYGREVLVHDADAVDLTRAAEGLPLLFGHNQDQPIGLAENVRLDDGKLRADLRFSNNARAQEIWTDVRDGFLKNISIGYQVKTWEENDVDDIVRVTDWSLLEASVVTVPADANVGVNRAQSQTEVKTMTDTTETRTNGDDAGPSSGTNVVDYQAARDAAKADGMVEGQRAERRRIDEIDLLFSGPGYQGREFQDLKKTLIKNGDSIDHARSQLLSLVGAGVEPVAADRDESRRDTFVMGATDTDKFGDAMSRTLEHRVGIEKDPNKIREIRESEFASMNMSELAREFCRRNSISTAGKTRDQVVGLAMRGVIGHGSSDFSNILESISTKSLLAGWDEAEETWSMWCRQGTLPDFKQASRTGLSSFEDLEIVYENGEYKHGTTSDLKEPIQLVTYGKMFNISRQALANDDLGALGAIPRGMGRAASRKVGDVAYGVLYSNSGVGPTLNQDSTALWDASGHSNYLASGSGAAPSVATVNTALTAMATQTDPSGNTITPPGQLYMLVPYALRATAQVLATAAYDPAGTAGTLTPNTVNGMFTVVADPRLDANLSTGWYLTANPNTRDTVEVAFLDGQSSPYLESKEGWSIDGQEYKVRIDAGVAVLDYRSMYKNYGA